ncbi:regulatory protein RecX [Aquisediminimonas profunda]|uniref:regulatory protein RecX n=1 Tax=Aquisediminimonas profunda TaxID=1550733 RepID=UPI001C629BC4|nr:regulatory protein RecX [Aquisediminimonas profunda]
MCAQQQASRPKRPRLPLDPATIRALALHYVGRYSTTAARLKNYLERKMRERGWSESGPPPDLDRLVEDFARLGYVNDDAFAAARVSSLLRRGYGARRVNADLRHAGIAADKAEIATRLDAESLEEAAMTFARRKRLGPFGERITDQKARNRAMAAFLRAGHGVEIARRILAIAPDDENLDDIFG